MRFSTVLVAVLPALAVADTSAAPSLTTVTSVSKTTITTTCTDTTYLTKTVTLQRVHTTVSTRNSTSTVIQPTGGITLPAPTNPAASSTPTALPTKGPASGGAALHAGKFAFAGVAGMVVAALL